MTGLTKCDFESRFKSPRGGSKEEIRASCITAVRREIKEEGKEELKYITELTTSGFEGEQRNVKRIRTVRGLKELGRGSESKTSDKGRRKRKGKKKRLLD